jgi:hypothetical protein
MNNHDYTRGKWVKQEDAQWNPKLEAAKTEFANKPDFSVSEVLAGYQCPREATATIYYETWFCARKQYGLGTTTKGFASTNKWKDWEQYKKDTAHDDERTQDYMRYNWVPDQCTLQQTDSEKLYGLLANRNLFMLGDSLSNQHFVSLACTLHKPQQGGPTSGKYGVSGGPKSGKITAELVKYYKQNGQKLKATGLGGEKDPYGRPDGRFEELRLDNGGFVRFGRLDHLFMEYLEYDADTSKADRLESFRIGWREFLTDNVPNQLGPDDVLLFNTGAHWTRREGKNSGTVVGYYYEHSMKDLEMLVTEMVSMVTKELGFTGTIVLTIHCTPYALHYSIDLRYRTHHPLYSLCTPLLHPLGTIVLRMNAPGHEGCENHKTGPLASASSEDAVFGRYNWARLSWEIDDVMAAAISSAPKSRVMNTSMARLRPDGKHIYEGYGGAIDCLHSCLPGPVDMYTRLLYNMLDQKAI